MPETWIPRSGDETSKEAIDETIEFLTEREKIHHNFCEKRTGEIALYHALFAKFETQPDFLSVARDVANFAQNPVGFAANTVGAMIADMSSEPNGEKFDGNIYHLDSNGMLSDEPRYLHEGEPWITYCGSKFTPGKKQKWYDGLEENPYDPHSTKWQLNDAIVQKLQPHIYLKTLPELYQEYLRLEANPDAGAFDDGKGENENKGKEWQKLAIGFGAVLALGSIIE